MLQRYALSLLGARKKTCFLTSVFEHIAKNMAVTRFFLFFLASDEGVSGSPCCSVARCYAG